MSSHNYSITCDKCSCMNSLNITENNRPYPSISGECVECGFTFWTIKDQMSLDELNEIRAEHEMEELSALPDIKVNEWRTANN